MIGVLVLSSPKGVNVKRARSNVMLPLLFTKTDPKLRPKKLIVNGSATRPVDPSSFAGRTLSRQPSGLVADGRTITAPAPGGGPPPVPGVTVSVAVLVTPNAVAVIVTTAFAVTVVVVIGKVFVVRPCETDTLAAKLAALLLELSATAKPPDGAVLVSVIFPVAPLPPTTLVGVTVTLASAAGVPPPPHDAPAVFAASVWSVPPTFAMCEAVVVRSTPAAMGNV